MHYVKLILQSRLSCYVLLVSKYGTENPSTILNVDGSGYNGERVVCTFSLQEPTVTKDAGSCLQHSIRVLIKKNKTFLKDNY